MREHFLSDIQCPACASRFVVRDAQQKDSEIVGGELICDSQHHSFPIVDGIPRFVPTKNYASGFGMQWNAHPQTQLDSKNNTTTSTDRFFNQTHWSRDLNGEKILEVGCGMGRFTEVALQTGATCFSLDYSNAVDAAKKNLGSRNNYFLTQASVYEMPFAKDSFDKIFCFGVLQHTPNVFQSFSNLVHFLKPGGHLAIDVYAAPWQWFHPKRLMRPITKYISPQRLYKIVQRCVPFLLPFSNAVGKIPLLGGVLKFAVPVANYQGRYPLTKEQVLEWAILDTFDWLSPRYDQPQFAWTVRRWMKKAGLQDIQIERNVGIYIARARKPE